jgi:membrane associated rhomboid family serine protease
MLFDSIWKDLRWHFRFGSPLTKIIYINIFVFLVINLLIIIGLFSGKDTDSWLVNKLSFAASKTFLYQPWSLLTYQFTHIGLMHILFNMLWLYWFGNIVQDFIGKDKIVPIYILGGFCGAIFFAITSFLVNYTNEAVHIGAYLYGASAGVMAVVFAAATLSPNYEIRLLFLGNVKLKWIALVILVLDIVMLPDGNFGGHIAHLGGAFFGWIYISMLRKGKDWAHTFYDVTNFFGSIFERKPKMKIVYQQPQKEKVYAQKENKQQQTNKNKDTAAMSKREKQEILDSILDKINSSGYDSLTPSEKEFLFKMSKED